MKYGAVYDSIIPVIHVTGVLRIIFSLYYSLLTILILYWLSTIWTGWAIYQNLPTRSNRKRVLPWPKLSTNANVWGRESERNFWKVAFWKLTCEWICGKYSFYKSLIALYNLRRMIILLTSMQCFHRGYVAEFCTLAQCSRSSNKNGDDFDVFYDSCHI